MVDLLVVAVVVVTSLKGRGPAPLVSFGRAEFVAESRLSRTRES